MDLLQLPAFLASWLPSEDGPFLHVQPGKPQPSSGSPGGTSPSPVEPPVRRSLFCSEGSGWAGQDFMLNSLLSSLT